MSKAIRKDKRIRRVWRLTAATVVGICLFVATAQVRDSGVLPFIGLQPAIAQFTKPADIGRQVYQRFPNLPRENQYVNKETGKVNPDDTLISRLIRYHIYNKSRPVNYRFDWKLTMADYLGANESPVESQYPGASNLKTNPMEGDIKAIQKLNRSQRDALINVLVSVFSLNRLETTTSAPTPRPSPSPSPSPKVPSTQATPSLPKPGDARLLTP